MNPQGSIFNKDDAENRPPISGNANDQRPSEGWLRNPAWIDGGVNPPRFYHSHQEVNDALIAAGIAPGIQYNQYAARVTPTPITTEPPAPLTPSLINSTNNHYRTGVDSTAPTSKGHLINVTLMYSSTTAVPTGRGKAVPKKCKNTKMDTILLDSITRVDFVKAILGVHNISDKFAPGVHSGPEFKMWWNGAVGGKGGAPSIQNDYQFSVALGALLKKDKSKVQVGVEIDIDDMEGFRIKHVLPPSISDAPTVGGDEELAYSTCVPHIDNFSKLSQLHSKFIINLKKKWSCQMHQGEHGKAGYCYVNPMSEHVRLNPLRLKTWAVAMAAGDATKHEPPNVNMFDGARDGRLNGPKARGRTGPFSSSAHTAALPDPNHDAMAVLVSALLGGLSRKRGRSTSESPTRLVPSTPKQSKPMPPTTNSPVPEAGHELRDCLRDFAKLEGIDLTSHEIALHEEDYTPDIIPFVDDAELRQIIGATRGIVIKFKMFCKEWYNRYQKKIHTSN